MTRPKKLGCLANVVGLLLLAAMVDVEVVRPVVARLRTFLVEDDIHGTFYPVVQALDRYDQEHGKPAGSLADLIPRYLKAVPASKVADPPVYQVSPTGRDWELSIHSTALAQPRLYVCRFPQRFSAQEERRMLLRYHGVWTVLAADR